MIYPSITSTAGNYLETIEEARKLGIKEICFFPTCIPLEQRKEVYKLLEKSEIKKIPLVHIREDFEVWEMDYLTERFSAEVFNCHTEKKYFPKNDLSKYRKKIFIENSNSLFDENLIKDFGGICLDFSHLHHFKFINKRVFDQCLILMKKYQIGCSHLSCFRELSNIEISKGKPKVSEHILINFSDMNYLENYQEYFPDIMPLELENNLEQQLKIIDYLFSKPWCKKK